MALPDIINSCFPIGGCIFTAANCVVLHQDKTVRGVNAISAIFFWLWAIWNVIFYVQIDQPFSMYTSIAMLVMSSTWTSMMFWYKYNK